MDKQTARAEVGEAIPITVSAALNSSGSFVLVQVAEGQTTDIGSSPHGTSIVILDRTDPRAAPVFTSHSSDIDEVPSGITPFLNDRYLLAVGFGGGVAFSPQGALFQLLMANGAGPLLLELETWATRFGCGYFGSFAYALLSVPGSGQTGLERLSNGVSSPFTGYITAAFVPGDDGLFTPVQIGS